VKEGNDVVLTNDSIKRNKSVADYDKKGIIFNIQRFSVHDGPGIRTLVFMKGCPLRCLWCCNPESLKSYPELGFIEGNCVKCFSCIDVCPNKAITVSEDGKIVTDREYCEACGKCVEVCKYNARKIVGKNETIDSILAEVERDRLFYTNSGGGITVSGGEPTQQHEFVGEFLKQCQEHFLNTAIETCGYVKWEYLEQILEDVDFLYYDIKHMDPTKHREFTGVSNELILENIERILSNKVKSIIVIRIPIIPGYTDSEKNIIAIGEFLRKFGADKIMIELLPYHQLGSSKYKQYGMEYKIKNIKPPNLEHMETIKKIIKSYGLKCQIG